MQIDDNLYKLVSGKVYVWCHTYIQYSWHATKANKLSRDRGM